MSVVHLLKAQPSQTVAEPVASSSGQRAFLDLSGVSIELASRGGSFRALDNVNLKIAKGEFVSVIGHSGCGKSTVLNIVAGLYQATEGGAILQGRGQPTGPGPGSGVPEPCALALADVLSKRGAGG